MIGEVQALNNGVADVVSEHSKVEPAAVEVKANVGVLLNETDGGCWVIVTAPIWYFSDATSPALPAVSCAKYWRVSLLATLTVTGDVPFVVVAVVGVEPSVV